MLKLIAVFALVFSASLALAHGRVSADETVPATAAAPKADAAKAAVAGAETEQVTLPPGFKPKKRGKYTLYCRTDTPIGTRFKHETCFDKDQIRDYLIALQENKSNVDRIRATCSTRCACGQPEAC